MPYAESSHAFTHEDTQSIPRSPLATKIFGICSEQRAMREEAAKEVARRAKLARLAPSHMQAGNMIDAVASGEDLSIVLGPGESSIYIIGKIWATFWGLVSRFVRQQDLGIMLGPSREYFFKSKDGSDMLLFSMEAIMLAVPEAGP